MPTPINNADQILVRVACYVNNQVGLNTFYFVLANAVGTNTLENFAGALDSIIAASYKPVLANTASYYGSSVQRIFPAPTQPVFTVANTGVGTGGADLSPMQASALITRFTAVAGRTGRGRVYIPFLPTAAYTAVGGLQGSFVTLINVIGTALLAPNTITTSFADTIDTNPQIVRQHVTWTTVTSYLTRTKIATQKRRGQYGRANSLPW